MLRRLRERHALADWQVARLAQWRHSGFTLDAGAAPLAATDAAGRRRLAEYLLRAPYSLEKITYNPAAGQVLYRSERHWRLKRNFEVFRAHDFIAALIDQLPVKGVPMVRYYGWYSNKSRGRRARIASGSTPESGRVSSPLSDCQPANPCRRRTCWRQLVQTVWGVDF